MQGVVWAVQFLVLAVAGSAVLTLTMLGAEVWPEVFGALAVAGVWVAASGADIALRGNRRHPRQTAQGCEGTPGTRERLNTRHQGARS